MQQEPDYARNPAAAFWRFLGALAACALFYGMASIGWPAAGFIFWVFVIMAVWFFFGIFRAHRAWKVAKLLHEEARNASKRHTTNPEPANPQPDRDGWTKPDGW